MSQNAWNKTSLPVDTIVLLYNLNTPQSRKHNGKQGKIISKFDVKTRKYLVEIINEPQNKGYVSIDNMKITQSPNTKPKSKKSVHPKNKNSSTNHNHSLNSNIITKKNSNLNLRNISGNINVDANDEKSQTTNGSKNSNCNSEAVMRDRPRMNISHLFTHKIMKSAYNLMNGALMNDFQSIMTGNCIYIPKFYNKNESNILFNQLTNEIKDSNINSKNNIQQRKVFRKRTVFYTNDESIGNGNGKYNKCFSLTVSKICNDLTNYFDCKLLHTVMNYYENGEKYMPFHRDGEIANDPMTITIGLSIGNTRNLSFLHEKTETEFDIPQRTGDVFAFTSVVNNKFKHGIRKDRKSIGPRFSVIVFGIRNTLNKRNSGVSERIPNKSTNTY